MLVCVCIYVGGIIRNETYKASVLPLGHILGVICVYVFTFFWYVFTFKFIGLFHFPSNKILPSHIMLAYMKTTFAKNGVPFDYRYVQNLRSYKIWSDLI